MEQKKVDTRTRFRQAASALFACGLAVIVVSLMSTPAGDPIGNGQIAGAIFGFCLIAAGGLILPRMNAEERRDYQEYLDAKKRRWRV